MSIFPGQWSEEYLYQVMDIRMLGFWSRQAEMVELERSEDMLRAARFGMNAKNNVYQQLANRIRKRINDLRSGKTESEKHNEFWDSIEEYRKQDQIEKEKQKREKLIMEK